MSKKATEFQKRAMSRVYRGREIFKPLNTGWIDENVACVREWVANIFFYRKVLYRLYKLPSVTINNEKQLLHDDQVLDIYGVKIECFLVPGHTWGHMVYLIDDKYLFTGDRLCSPFKKKPHDPSAPYDAYDESDDTEEKAKSGYLKGVGRYILVFSHPRRGAGTI